MRSVLGLAVLAAAGASAPVIAQVETVPIAGTRLELSAEGEVTREPDIATVNAGVVTQSGSAASAMAANAQKMAAVVAALRHAGVAERDIRTARLTLQPQYRYAENQPPAITGYQASNQLNVTFRDITRAGPILDVLVAQGVNQIGGPDFAVEHPDAALDEARVAAMAKARARADLYAKAAGLHVARIAAVTESGGYSPPAPRPMMAVARMAKADTAIDPGTEKIGVTLNVVFELK